MEKSVTANSVADFFIRFAHKCGDCITNKKLQKLVYYAQAWHLALYDKPLFRDRFEAWIFGPVQPRLYQRFKKYGSDPINEQPSKPDISSPAEKHLKDVIEAYWKFTAWELERMVHQEDPWKKARNALAPDKPSSKVISQEDMKKYYKQRLSA
jgi:uncharacterized phage-associated protein